MANSYEYIPTPSFSGEYGQFVSPELLYSHAKFTQHGYTIVGGQGELPLGTIICPGSGANASKYVKFTNAAGQKATAFLRVGVDAGASGSPDQLTRAVDSGIIKLELVQAAYGGGGAANTIIDAALVTLNGRRDDANMFISF